jgi:hypothetical protein
MVSTAFHHAQPLVTSNLANLPKPATMETPKHQIAYRSALSSVVSSDPMWEDEILEDDMDDDPPPPDFHFEWKSDEEKNEKETPNRPTMTSQVDRRGEQGHIKAGRTSNIALGRPNGPPRTHSAMSNHGSDAQTPPQGYGNGSGSGFSARSSTSSVRVASLTDASTVSASSMVPTPPSALGHLSRASMSSHGSGSGGSGGSGDRPLGRTYGGNSSRTFQRHVSAPLHKNWPSREDTTDAIEEVSLVSPHSNVCGD